MKNNGVDCRQMINPVHLADHFESQYFNSAFKNAVHISNQSAHLPSGLGLRDDHIIEIKNTSLSICIMKTILHL